MLDIGSGFFYVKKQVREWLFLEFSVRLRVNLASTGKAETGSAGEQPVRNSLFDWNGQKGWGKASTFFIGDHSRSLMPKKTHLNTNIPFQFILINKSFSISLL